MAASNQVRVVEMDVVLSDSERSRLERELNQEVCEGYNDGNDDSGRDSSDDSDDSSESSFGFCMNCNTPGPKGLFCSANL